MMKVLSSLFLVVVLLSIGVSSADEPDVYPCARCDKCVSASSDVKDSECAVCAGGDKDHLWDPCNNAEKCTCSEKSKIVVDCDKAVSNDGVTPNSACVQLCKDGADSFDSQCILEDYKFLQTVRLYEPKCFTKNVYGYEDKAPEDADYYSWANFGSVVENTKTAGECQEKCQEDPSCVYFQWRVASDRGNPDDDGACMLKTQEMIDNALSPEVPMHPRESEGTKSQWSGHVEADDSIYKWYAWCNLGLRYECFTNHYACLTCPDLVCAYKSEYHITGPKYCGAGISDCSPASYVPETTEAPVVTSPADDVDDDDDDDDDEGGCCSCYDGFEDEEDRKRRLRRGYDVMLLEDVAQGTSNLHEYSLVHATLKALKSRLGNLRVSVASFADSEGECYKLHTHLRKCVRVAQRAVTRLVEIEDAAAGAKENQLGALVAALTDKKAHWKRNKKFILLFTNAAYRLSDGAASSADSEEKGCGSDFYPSFDAVKEALSSSGVHPVFVVPAEVKQQYVDLVSEIGQGEIVDATSASLAEDIVKAIKKFE